MSFDSIDNIEYDPDYTSQYADGIIIKCEENLMVTLTFFQRREEIDESGKNFSDTQTKILKFDVKVPFEVIFNLLNRLDRIAFNNLRVMEGKKFDNLTSEEKKAYARKINTFFLERYDTDKPDNPYMTNSKIYYIATGLQDFIGNLMMKRNNPIVCYYCDRIIAYEKLDSHLCFKGRIIDYYFDTDYPDSVIIFDGKKWYKVSDEIFDFLIQTPKLNTKKLDDQNHDILPVLVIKTLII